MHPGQVAFDLYSAERVLEVLDGREEFGFTFDPSHLHWQGVDPVEFLRRFPERIYHVHIKDVQLCLNGRNGLLGSYLPYGDPRRGWDFRAPGHGGLDWEAIFRGLNDIGYSGPLAVEYKDTGINRDFGAEEACKFVRRMDFPKYAACGLALANGSMLANKSLGLRSARTKVGENLGRVIGVGNSIERGVTDELRHRPPPASDR